MSRETPIRNHEQWKAYTDLVRRVERRELNPDDIFAQIDEKRRVLGEVFGYSSLKGSGSVPVPLAECDAGRVGGAFKTNYNSAVNKLARQGVIEALTSGLEESCDMEICGKNYHIEVRR